MTQKEHDKKVTELMTSLVEAEKQIQNIRKELDELDKVEIEPESRRWKPKRGQTYYFITATAEIISNTWNEGYYDILRFAIDNVFETYEEAEFEIERLKVIAELKEFAEPDDSPWNSESVHYYIDYIIQSSQISISSVWCSQHLDIYFKSIERAREAIKAVGEDRIKKYYLRVKE